MNERQYYDLHKRNQESRTFYKSRAWERCRALVLLRDHQLCQDCFKQKRLKPADMVHHIVELTDDPSLALVESNLVSLCNSCHNKRHPEKGSGGKRKKKQTRSGITVIKSKANEERM